MKPICRDFGSALFICLLALALLFALVIGFISACLGKDFGSCTAFGIGIVIYGSLLIAIGILALGRLESPDRDRPGG